MGYNDFFQHKYKVVRVSKPGRDGKEISSTTVIGSRKAREEQDKLEEQGLPVHVVNLTKGELEYWTPAPGEEVEVE